MLDIQDSLISPNPYSRPESKIVEVRALVVHWTATPMQDVGGVRAFYEQRKLGRDGYGSAHCGISFDGKVQRWVPDAEVAYAVGSSQVDPASGKVYTDLARELFGSYASSRSSPNYVTLSAEWMTLDDKGTFTSEEYDAAVQLYAAWCEAYRLDPATRILTHQQVVGWKPCHRWFVDHPADLDKFRQDVAAAIA